jgi:penicillin-binding protein 2
MDLRMAIAQSCDTYFYTVGKAVGIDAFAETAKTLGLGALSDLGLRGEKAGIMPTPEWKEAVGRGPWNPGETINSAIGQGDVLATPLQMAIMMARLCNGGKKVVPRLTRSDAPVSFEDAGFDPDHLAVVMEGVDWVVNNPRGTAYGSRIMHGDTLFAGKTGTAQVRKILVRGQDQNHVPWHLRHHAWFVAYGPTLDPQYAACILIEHGGGGSSAAAPVARDIMQKVMELYG